MNSHTALAALYYRHEVHGAGPLVVTEIDFNDNIIELASNDTASSINEDSTTAQLVGAND